jgi:2,4-dienoyl-CoA reductase-like NADH-dependent reductase (Old Yellow Enzyme family)
MTRDLFLPAPLGSLELRNRIIMAPMTRNRSIGNIPPLFAAKYYGQRSGAGLIVTEGTSPSPNGLGYARIPGLFSRDQVAGWRRVTRAVLRKAYPGTLILSGGYDRDRAEADLASAHADLVAFGRPFIANPDLPERLRNHAALAVPDPATFYTPGEAGYTDYPALTETVFTWV